MKQALDIEHTLVFGNMRSAVFYKTQEWRSARYNALKIYGNRCQLCGSGPQNGHQLHVDHIRPRSLFPERCLDFHNLQILCETCHIAKGLKYTDDCRETLTKISPIAMKDFLRVTNRHMVLEIRHPKSRIEKDYLSEDVRSDAKKHRKRWRALVNFCFREKISYPEAVILKISDFMGMKTTKGKQYQKFFNWGDERGFKSENDPAFDIAGFRFPEHVIDLLADDQKRWRIDNE